MRVSQLVAYRLTRSASGNRKQHLFAAELARFSARANVVTGYTVKAMQRKIERGDWQEGKVWRRAPDGRIFIDLVGYERWVEAALGREAARP